MHTAIVILNWNTSLYLQRFIPGILKSIENEDAELIVADNGSSDGSMEKMSKRFPMVRTIGLDKNYGFTGGYNKVLLENNDADYFLLLNSDIEVTDNWLHPLVETLDNDNEVGICSPKIHSFYNKEMFEYAGAAGGYIDRYGFPFCRGRVMGMVEKDSGQYDKPADVFWASGACMLIRRSVFQALDGFDHRFFAHMEEIDLCWRAQLLGYRIRIVPDSVVYHMGGGTLPNNSPWKLKLNFRNNLLMLENNLAATYARELYLQRIHMKDNSSRHTANIKEADCENEQILKICAVKGAKLAKKTILRRKFIDGLIGIGYAITFKFNNITAIVQAHREFGKLSSFPTYDNIMESMGKAPKQITGIYPKWIIPEAVLRRRHIFSYLRKNFKPGIKA